MTSIFVPAWEPVVAGADRFGSDRGGASSANAQAWQREMERNQMATWFQPAQLAQPSVWPLAMPVSQALFVTALDANSEPVPQLPMGAGDSPITVASESTPHTASGVPETQRAPSNTDARPAVLNSAGQVGQAAFSEVARSSGDAPAPAQKSQSTCPPSRPRLNAAASSVTAESFLECGSNLQDLQATRIPTGHGLEGMNQRVLKTGGAVPAGAVVAAASTAATPASAPKTASGLPVAALQEPFMDPLPVSFGALVVDSASPLSAVEPSRSIQEFRPVAGTSMAKVFAQIPGQPTVRMHTQWSASGVQVWLGVDGSDLLAQAPALAAIVAELQRTLAQLGLSLGALVCNGRTVYQLPKLEEPVDRLEAESQLPTREDVTTLLGAARPPSPARAQTTHSNYPYQEH